MNTNLCRIDPFRFNFVSRLWRLHQAAAIALLVLANGVLCAQSTPGESPGLPGADRHIDRILTNGQVLTPAGWVEALAISDGVIVAVGAAAEIKALQSADTELIDLDGGTVLPGLHDMHVHPLFAGLEQFACGFAPGAAPGEIAEAMGKCVADKEPGEWIQGGNWIGAVFEPGQQNKEFLDEVAPHNPVILTDEAHHSVWLNSRALEVAGITPETPNPTDGIIERDASGEPNGLLRETAVGLAYRAMPPPNEARKRLALTLASNIMLSFGITSYQIASVRGEELATIAALSEEGVIKQRVRACLVWSPTPDALRLANESSIAQREHYARARLATDCVKMFLDGVPLESRTAAMLEPYQEPRGAHESGRPDKGFLMVPQRQLDEIVTRYDRQGLEIKFHAAGDALVRAAMDAVAVAREANGWGGPMHHVGHNSFVSFADILRARDLHMAWEFSPYIWYPTPIASLDALNAVGAERMKRFIPIKDALDTGALVVAGSDWSVVPSVNPWLAMETMVTRQMPGGSDETLAVSQTVSLESAFRILTTNGARMMGHANRVGSIETGMRADIVVTATNPFEAPITRVHATEVIMTIIDGELVYHSASPPQLTPN